MGETNEKPKFGCSCGRSPIGRCVGWHKLSDKRWIEAIAKYQKMTPKQREAWLSPKAIDGFGE
jgi:hypothetical protein|tara:strand:+ start:116 stop:304 length:189 start_codon:yes stop_codon:yes gene_type:complete